MTEKEDFLLDLFYQKDKECKAAWIIAENRQKIIDELNGVVKNESFVLRGIWMAIDGYFANNHPKIKELSYKEVKDGYEYSIFRLWQIWDANKERIQ